MLQSDHLLTCFGAAAAAENRRFDCFGRLRKGDGAATGRITAVAISKGINTANGIAKMQRLRLFEICGRRPSAARVEKDARSAPKRILHTALQPLKRAAETGAPRLMRRNGILFRCSNIVVFAVCTSGCYRWTYNAVMISSAFTIFLYDCGCCSSFAPTTFIFNYYCSFLHYRSVIRLTG